MIVQTKHFHYQSQKKTFICTYLCICIVLYVLFQHLPWIQCSEWTCLKLALLEHPSKSRLTCSKSFRFPLKTYWERDRAFKRSSKHVMLPCAHCVSLLINSKSNHVWTCKQVWWCDRVHVCVCPLVHLLILFTVDRKPINTHEHRAFVLSVKGYNQHSFSGQMTQQWSHVRGFKQWCWKDSYIPAGVPDLRKMTINKQCFTCNSDP